MKQRTKPSTKKLFGKLLFMLAMPLLASTTAAAQTPADYVNPFIGTMNFGACYPGPVAPQGMVSIVPLNVTKHPKNQILNLDSQWVSTPYVKENQFMTGFSHINLSGVGCPDLGSIMVMPTTGKLEVDYQKYGSTYQNEQAQAGYYSVELDNNVKAEMTATTRSGLSRYTFPKGQSNIILNMGHGLSNEAGAQLRIVNDQEIEGMRMLGTFCFNPQAVFPVYFVMKLDKKPKKIGYWKKMKTFPGPQAEWGATSGKYKIYADNYKKEMMGDNCGVYCEFETQEGEQIQVQVGISYVSIENARLNLETEQQGFDFAKTRKETKAAWNEMLSRILVEGGQKDDKTIFYTALYHLLLHPNILQDVNGQYPAMESSEIKTASSNRYTVFSLWDTYRNVHQFLSLVYPEIQVDMVNSMIDMYKESGWLPKWELFSQETHVMEGDPAITVIADSYLRGLRGFDIELAYKAMLKSATTPGKDNPLRPDNDDYLAKGYCPLLEQYDNSVSHALEYYVADWNLGQLAKALGKTKDYERFNAQSLRYKEYFSKEFNILRPKLADGTFYKPFIPTQGVNWQPSPGFHEGSAWHYTFMVPHDIEGMISLMGGSQVFVDTLQKVFDKEYFEMNNEPDIAYPYLFNKVKGEEWRTQFQVNRLLRKYYFNAPGGIPGNDDTGTLSAWLLFSMMGLYPDCPGNPDFAITSPQFEKIDIQLNPQYYPKGKLTITSDKKTADQYYIDEILVGRKKHNSFYIKHQDLVKAGSLEFKLKTKP